jgi:hypothetical protein
MPLAAQMGRLRVAHSADLGALGSQFDPVQLMQQQPRPRWGRASC